MLALCCVLARGVLAADAPAADPVRQPKPGCILVREADGTLSDLPVALLQQHVEYQVTVKTYHDPESQAAMPPDLPLSPAAELKGETTLVLTGQDVAVGTSTGSAVAVRQVANGAAKAGDSAPALHYLSFVLVYGPEASRGLDNPYGPADGAQRKVVAQSDHVACGGLDFYMNCPDANRFEVFVQRADAPGEQLRYTAGDVWPTVVRTTEPVFAPYAWLSGTLQAKDAGYLFSDGTPAQPAPDGPASALDKAS
jgi:hypothetical protein